MTDDFQSISKGIFIIPYQGASEDDDDHLEPEAGPSRHHTRPLKGWYDHANEAFSVAHESYETERIEEQLEDVADWLEGCASAPSGGLDFGFETTRLPIGIMQDTSPRITSLLGRVAKHRAILQGREVVDLAAGIRGVALGLLDDPTGLGKSGRSGMDEVERWYRGLPPARQSPLLIHIQDAQLASPSGLSELIYVLSLRPALPLRVLLSVPSVSTFLASLLHIEASGVEVNVLGLGAKRASGGSVAAVLKADLSSSNGSSLRISHDLAAEMEDDEKMYGGGPAAALKGLRWRLLHHNVNSPLSTLAEEDADTVGTIGAMLPSGSDEAGLWASLLEIGTSREAQATLNPAPRVSVLHALSNSAAYTSRLPKTHRSNVDDIPRPLPAATASPRSAKRRRTNRTILSPVDDVPAPAAPLQSSDGQRTNPDSRGDMKELEVLFNLWRSAGRNVNLWDWLEGFRGSLMGSGDQPTAAGAVATAREAGDESVEGTPRGAAEAEGGEPQPEPRDEAAEEEEAARLHAVFVRFCEEARMMGLVRARGRAKRADEVVKSIALV